MNESSTERVAIMQPYLFPYLGYFNLIDSSSIFIFYDDVNFIKRGWINRNRILLNGEAHLITIPLKQATQNAFINEIETSIDKHYVSKLEQKLTHAYKKAPHFKAVIELVLSVISTEHKSISDLCIASIESVCSYIDLSFEYKRSSEFHSASKGMDRAERLISITKAEGCETYINAIGGKEIYHPEEFSKHGIQLNFVDPICKSYEQLGNEFVPWLSIIDVLMFNDIPSVKELLKHYRVS